MIISTFFKKNNPNPNPIPIAFAFAFAFAFTFALEVESAREEKRRGEEWNVVTSHLEIQYRIEKRRRSFKEFSGVSRRKNRRKR